MNKSKNAINPKELNRPNKADKKYFGSKEYLQTRVNQLELDKALLIQKIESIQALINKPVIFYSDLEKSIIYKKEIGGIIDKEEVCKSCEEVKGNNENLQWYKISDGLFCENCLKKKEADYQKENE